MKSHNPVPSAIEFNWTKKQSDSYIDGNYGVLTSEDAAIDRELIKGIVDYDETTPIIGRLATGLVIGTGRVLRGPAFIAPLISSDGKLYITDVSENNVLDTRLDLERVKEGHLGLWTPHEEHMAECHPAWEGSFSRAATLSLGHNAIKMLDVADLKRDMAEIASLDYVLESRGHEDIDVWERDLDRTADAASKYLQIRQTDDSEAYMAGDKRHLAVRVWRERTEERLMKNGFEIIASHTTVATGQARQPGDTNHYSGFSGIFAGRL